MSGSDCRPNSRCNDGVKKESGPLQQTSRQQMTTGVDGRSRGASGGGTAYTVEERTGEERRTAGQSAADAGERVGTEREKQRRKQCCRAQEWRCFTQAATTCW